MTNFEKIKQFNDKELANLLGEIAQNFLGKFFCKGRKCRDYGLDCRKCAIIWLNEEESKNDQS